MFVNPSFLKMCPFFYLLILLNTFNMINLNYSINQNIFLSNSWLPNIFLLPNIILCSPHIFSRRIQVWTIRRQFYFYIKFLWDIDLCLLSLSHCNIHFKHLFNFIYIVLNIITYLWLSMLSSKNYELIFLCFNMFSIHPLF